MMASDEMSITLSRDSLSRPWGFRIQGGADVGAPLTVQRVFSGSPAEGILHRGDVITSIDSSNTTNISNKEAQDLIRVSEGQMVLGIQRSQEKPVWATMPLPSRQSTETSSNRLTNGKQVRHQMKLGEFGVQYGDLKPRQPNNDVIMAEKIKQSLSQFASFGTDYRQLANKSASFPRQRSLSYRPQGMFRADSNPVINRRPDFGWAPSAERIAMARQTSLSSSSIGQLNNGAWSSPQNNYSHYNNTPQGATYVKANSGSYQFNTSFNVGAQNPHTEGHRRTRHYSTSSVGPTYASPDAFEGYRPAEARQPLRIVGSSSNNTNYGAQGTHYVNLGAGGRSNYGTYNTYSGSSAAPHYGVTITSRREFHPAYPVGPNTHPHGHYTSQISSTSVIQRQDSNIDWSKSQVYRVLQEDQYHRQGQTIVPLQQVRSPAAQYAPRSPFQATNHVWAAVNSAHGSTDF